MIWNGLATNAYWGDSCRLLFNKDCRAMTELPDEIVQMVCCSPPYYGLRRYSGLPDLIWGGKLDCKHEWGKELLTEKQRNWDTWKATDGKGENRFSRARADGGSSQGSFCSLCGAWKGQLGLEPSPEMYIEHLVAIFYEVRRVLRKDGVCFVNIGDSYAGSGKGQNADGSPGKSGKLQQSNKGTQTGGIPISIQVSHNTPKANYKGLKPKDLCLIPFRLAIALQENGWWVRSVIIWNKPNPMPESITDRPTESHEYILMLTKSARYFWDSNAVRESGIVEGFTSPSNPLIFSKGIGLKDMLSEKSIPPSGMSHNRLGEIAIYLAATILNNSKFNTKESLLTLDTEIGQQGIDSIYGRLIGDSPSMKEAAVFANRLLMTDMTAECFLKQLDNLKIGITDSQQLGIRRISTLMSNTPFTRSDTDAPLTINNPSQVSQQQFILHNKEHSTEQDTLSSKVRGLKTKGDAEILGEQHHGQDIFPQSGGRNLRSVWSFPTQSFSGAHFATYPEKLVELCVKAATPEVGCCSKCGKPWVRIVEKGFKNNEYKPRIDEKYSAGSEFMSDKTTLRCDTESQTLGWKQACKCQDADKVPSIVLDPFAGSGTTLKVAAELNRRAIGYELSQDYCSLAVGRNKQGIIL